MADTAISGQRGTTITVVADAAPLDLAAAGTTAVLTAKRRRGDAPPPLIEKTYLADGGSDPGVSYDAPAKELTFDIEPADTITFAATEFLVFDVIVTQGGDETPILKGALTVRAGVGS